MIRFDGVTVTYPDAQAPAIRDVDLTVDDGELCLVVGRTGSGKTTLLRCVNGLVPHFTGGLLAGHVTVGGRDTRTHPPRELADLVGYVGQAPAAGFVTDVVEDELAYAMESMGLRPDVMRRRVEEVLDMLGLADVRDRPLLALSAGQQQRVAIGSVLTLQPQVLVLDEPTSALDPPAAEDVLALLTRLVHDLGMTVLLAEHRLERVAQYADRVVAVAADGTVTAGLPGEVLADADARPPVVELGLAAGWRPPPLSVRDARRAAAPLRERLALAPPARPLARGRGAAAISYAGVHAAYDDVWALRGIDLTFYAGQVSALMGRNGAGKSTLLAAAAGVRPVDRGEVTRTGKVALVPQEPGDVLWAATVREECADADRDWAVASGTTEQLLHRLASDVDTTSHPRDLSEGQRLMLALAVMLAGSPNTVALDEPTRGLDYAAKHRLVEVLRGLADGGGCVVLATHDVELAADVADRVVILADGEVVADGPAAEVVLASPAFAPQVAKVFAPVPVLTVAEAKAALA